jgi:DNA-binding GntR family transcriptional regulator
MTEPQLRGPRTISEQIADACGMMIVDGSYKAGQRMIEQQVAEQFGVSRGPVREAFRILQKRRLIDITPRKGAHVLPISLESIADLFNVRIALACLAARTMSERPAGNSFLDRLRERVEELDALADAGDTDPLAFAYAATRAVHAIARGSGNQLVIQMMSELNEQTIWTTIWKTPLDYVTAEARRLRANQIKAVMQNIQAGQGNAAELNLRLALEESRDAALVTLRGQVPGGAG